MIFYFSGTGNTEWAAQHVADAFEETLVDIPSALKGNCHYALHEGERIGFYFPVHGWRTPMIVRKFIDLLTFEGNNESSHYTYAICTAGDTLGETIDILKKQLTKRGLHLDSAFSLIMPESYVGLPFMDVDKKEKELSKKQTASEQIGKYISLIREKRVGVFNLKRGNWPRTNSRLLGAFFEKKLITDKPFHVESARCVKCGICADVCPVDDIKGGLGFEPEWKHNGSCLTCFACYHHCPHHAIEFGRRTQHKGQYFFNRRHR